MTDLQFYTCELFQCQALNWNVHLAILRSMIWLLVCWDHLNWVYACVAQEEMHFLKNQRGERLIKNCHVDKKIILLSCHRNSNFVRKSFLVFFSSEVKSVNLRTLYHLILIQICNSRAKPEIYCYDRVE